MEYHIDVDDGKRLEVKSASDELFLIFIHKDGEICLMSEMYQALKAHADKLSQALLKVCAKAGGVNCNVDLGQNVYAYVKSPYRCVQIRQFEEVGGDDSKNIATREGISLKRAQWFSLLGTFVTVDKDFATPKKPEHCGEFHANQEDYFSCSICYPTSVTETPKRKKKSFNPKKKNLDDVRGQIFT